MTDYTILAPNEVYKNGTFVANGLWAGGDGDSTYDTIARTDAHVDNTHGWLPAPSEVNIELDGIPGGDSSITALAFYIRASATSTSGSDVPVSQEIAYDNPGGTGSVPGNDLIATASVPADGAIHNIEHVVDATDYSTLGLDMAAVIARLRGGSGTNVGRRALRFRLANVWITFPAGATWTLTIYEAWLNIYYRRAAPSPLRRWPHLDGFGQGPRRYPSPPRLRPPSGGGT